MGVLRAGDVGGAGAGDLRLPPYLFLVLTSYLQMNRLVHEFTTIIMV